MDTLVTLALSAHTLLLCASLNVHVFRVMGIVPYAEFGLQTAQLAVLRGVVRIPRCLRTPRGSWIGRPYLRLARTACCFVSPRVELFMRLGCLGLSMLLEAAGERSALSACVGGGFG